MCLNIEISKDKKRLTIIKNWISGTRVDLTKEDQADGDVKLSVRGWPKAYRRARRQIVMKDWKENRIKEKNGTRKNKSVGDKKNTVGEGR